MQFPELKPCGYAGEVFRNIYTCAPSQDLFSDICDAEDVPFVDFMVQQSSGIDHHLPQALRPFQYADLEDEEIYAVFVREHWGQSRFSDGSSYGVWYSAEDELTSIHETAWWAWRLALDNVLGSGQVYTSDRVMYQAELRSSRAADLTQTSEWLSPLTHPHDYGFCQALGQKAYQEKFELLRTHSARRPGGVCVPVFQRGSIQRAGMAYYLRFHCSPDGMVGVQSPRPELNFSLTYAKDAYQAQAIA